MIYFVGAGCGAADLITVRGADLIRRADVLIYAGSLVNPALLRYARKACCIYNSASMALDEIIEVMAEAESKNQVTVRLHTGEPSIYGAVREQMRQLDHRGIPYESCPGVSACFGAAASLNLEYTLPGVSQTLIITRMEGRTSVPPKESIESFAAHGASMAIYLSTGMIEELSRRLIAGGYSADTPAAIVYKASWPEEEKYICTVGTLPTVAAAHSIRNLAVVLVGDVITQKNYEDSRLYAPDFATGFRKARTLYETGKKRIHIASYTDSAREMAHHLMQQWPEYMPAYHNSKENPDSWVPEAFRMHQPILFVSASGIAIRGIAASVQDKLTDSPVLVLDEKGKHVIPLLAGHMGGANELAREIANRIGADLVLTTATDVNGLFSVDDFARRNALRILNRDAIRKVSARVLRGESITIHCEIPALWEGKVPERVIPEYKQTAPDVRIGYSDEKNEPVNPTAGVSPLYLKPRDLVLGIGCKRGTPFAALHEFVSVLLQRSNLDPEDIGSIASVTQKRDELGLIELAQFYRVPLHLYSAEDLERVPGEFRASDFVRTTIGTGNVCQRAAALDSAASAGLTEISPSDGKCNRRDEDGVHGENERGIHRGVESDDAEEMIPGTISGEMILPKTVGNGITVSIYRRKFFRFHW